MLRYILVFISLVYLPFAVKGQADVSFSQKFDWPTGYRETLPEWVFYAQTDTLIGISDPYLKPEVAKEQALQRAFFLYTLRTGADVNVLFDYFTAVKSEFSYQRQINKLIVMISLTSKADSLEYQIVNEHYSKYGEVYLAITVKEIESEMKTLMAQGEMLLVENNELREEQDMKVFLDLNTSGMETVKRSCFLCKGSSGYKKIESSINNSRLYIPGERYWYANAGVPLNDYNESHRLLNSFWCAQMESLLKALTMHTFSGVYLKKLDENSDDQTQELKREIVKDSISLTVTRMSIVNNNLYTDWCIAPVSQDQ